MQQRKAPSFSLLDQHGETKQLKDYIGRWVVLYFYPRDFAYNCNREACNFRDEYRAIAQFGNAEIIGINRGSVASHSAFSKKFRLEFPILSDVGHVITSQFGAWRSGNVRLFDKPFGTRRNTYIINPKGYIVQEFVSVNPATHAEEIINALQELQVQSKPLEHSA
ncbi:peroxiredoxin [Candidatus Saccharibacteria bacterium]|nr:peroxiredoxin [Candidatus Saccharibacteria bacterium]